MNHPDLVREHFTRAGKPKAAYGSREEVEASPHHEKRHVSYQCSICGMWHRGTPPKRDEGLQRVLELLAEVGA